MRLLLIAILFALTQSAYADSFYVSKLSFIGNQRFEDKKLTKLTKLPLGNLNSKQVNSAVKRLFATGYFKNILVKQVGQELIFKLEEYPKISKTLLDGNDNLAASEIKKVLKDNPIAYYQPSQIQQITEALEFIYQTKGYLDAEVNHKLESDTATLIFEFQEGDRFKVSEILINADKEIDSDVILDKLQTNTYKWWSSWATGTGRLNNLFLEADRNRVLQGMLDQGYINAVVAEPRVEREGQALKVVFDVSTGRQFKYGDISVSGDLFQNSLTETLKAIKLEKSEVFSASDVRDQSLALADIYADTGYAFTNVLPRSNVNFKEETVDLAFEVDQGKKVKINRINISGNQKTYENVIRRELRVDEQEFFSRKKVNRSERLLKRTGYFEDVTISNRSVSDDLIDLDIAVKEGNTGSFSIGGGVSSSDGALFNARLSENNFMGTGRQVTLNADVGQRRSNYFISLDDPRINDSYWRGGFRVFSRELVFDDFDRKNRGLATTVGYPLEQLAPEEEWLHDINFALTFQYLDITIDGIDLADASDFVIASEGSTTAGSIIPKLVRNTIDNPLHPTTGSKQRLSFEVAGLIGDEDYYGVEFSNQFFYPLMKTENDFLVFSWRINLGYMNNNNDGPLPLFKRYFPGGINSVRGFDERTLGPKDSNGNEFGGNKQLVNNLELIFPLASDAGLRGVVFYDMGNSFDDEETINFADLRKSVGFGFRWLSPAGPIRIEFGHPLDREDDEGSFVTLFSFGTVIR